MAMLTPAQKPRGLARMIFTGSSPPWYRLLILPSLRDAANGTAGPNRDGKRHRHPRDGLGGGDALGNDQERPAQSSNLTSLTLIIIRSPSLETSPLTVPFLDFLQIFSSESEP